MSEHDPVQPLAKDATIGDELRAALDAAGEHEPSRADLASLGKRLAAVLPPGTLPPAATPPTTPPAAGGAAGGLATKAIAGLAIATAIGGAVWLSRGAGKTEPSQPAPVASVAAMVPSVSATASVVAETAAPDAAPTPSVTAASAAPPVHVAPPASSAAVAAPEAVILKNAHDALLQGSPDRALALASEHARAYPRGALAQEREVIAIESLVKLGRRDEALGRARAFHAAYPGSSHGERVDRLLERP